MLIHLHIRDFTIIRECEIELGGGMSALTGETGAGKSILIDALSLVLGGRADPACVRDGAMRSEISATFQAAPGSAIAGWLEAHDLDDEDICQLRRVIPADGKSRGYVNGRPVAINQLRTLARHVVDIHGQHEHYQLTQRQIQRELLDSMLPNRTLLDQVDQTWRDWQQLDQKIESLNDTSQLRLQRIDLLRFQINEFDELDTGQSELDSIENEHRRLSDSGRLLSLAEDCLQALDAENAAASLLNRAARSAETLAGIDNTLQNCSESINTAAIITSEAASTLRAWQSDLDLDEEKLQYVDQRLSALHPLARKHQCDIPALTSVIDALRAELDAIDNSADQLESLIRERDALAETYAAQARKLNAQRRRIARSMARDVTEIMQSLNMSGGVFDVSIQHEDTHASQHGSDLVRFMVSANPGVPAGEIGKIASGGELSRISLAISLVTRKRASLPVLIFDEVDSGIGGAVAETVGRYLRRLADRAQVLCVTHLPQVAAQAHHHIKVSKTVRKKTTHTRLEVLDKKQTIDEIARMLGGARLTSRTRQHAREMLSCTDAETGDPA